MDELIIVERGDGLTVIGLLTAVLAHWDDLPLGVQAAIIDHASRTAFDNRGRADGRYVITAFVLRHRAAMARRRRERDTLGFKVRGAFDKMAEGHRRVVSAAIRWSVSQWLAARRNAA